MYDVWSAWGRQGSQCSPGCGQYVWHVVTVEVLLRRPAAYALHINLALMQLLCSVVALSPSLFYWMTAGATSLRFDSGVCPAG